jgi:hypothetical protein
MNNNLGATRKLLLIAREHHHIVMSGIALHKDLDRSDPDLISHHVMSVLSERIPSIEKKTVLSLLWMLGRLEKGTLKSFPTPCNSRESMLPSRAVE